MTNFNNLTLANPPAFLPGLTEQACAVAPFPVMCREQFGNCVGNCFNKDKFDDLKSNLKCELSLLQWDIIRDTASDLGGAGMYTGPPLPDDFVLLDQVNYLRRNFLLSAWKKIPLYICFQPTPHVTFPMLILKMRTKEMPLVKSILES